MYYLKIDKMWVSHVRETDCVISKEMIHGWSNIEDAEEAANIVARITNCDVLKLEVIRAIEA